MSGGRQHGGIWEPGQRALTVGLLLTISIAAFEALAVATILPVTVRDLGGLGWYGWVFSAFMLSSLVSITMAGSAADRHGPARPFSVGGALFVAGLLVAGFAPSMPIVVLGRVVQGLGAGALSSVAYVAVTRGYRTEVRPRMLAMFSSAWVLPGLVGPALAGAAAENVGWRWVFLALAPVTAIAVALAMPSLRRFGAAADAGPPGGDTRTAFALAVGTGLVLLGIEDDSTFRMLALVAAGLALAGPALGRLLPQGTLRVQRGAPAALVTMALLSFSFFGAEAFLPLALTGVGGEAVTIAGVALTVGALTWTAGAWIQARLSSRVSRRALATTGLALTLVGVTGTAGLSLSGAPALTAALSWGVVGLGIGLAYSTLTLVVLETAAVGREGSASAALQLANVLGVALGTGLGGAALSMALRAGQTQADGLRIADAMMILAAALGLAAARRLPASSGQDEIPTA